nr:hypothetical protein [Tanacetum cinerariifolium]
MASNFNNKNDPWEYNLDVDDYDIHLTHVLRSSVLNHLHTPQIQLPCVEPSSSTQNLVRIIPGPVGVVQRAKLLRENVFIFDSDGALMSTQEYMQKVVEDVGEDDDFNSGPWFSATNYVIATGGIVTGRNRGILRRRAKDEKERARAEKEWEDEMKIEEAHNELLRLEVEVISDSKYETD